MPRPGAKSALNMRKIENHWAQGHKLLELRKSRNMSAETAARSVGVSVSTWGRWERGETSPYSRNWTRIEEVFASDCSEVRGDSASQLDRIEQMLVELQKTIAAQAAVFIQRQEALHRMVGELSRVMEGRAGSRAGSAGRQTLPPGLDRRSGVDRRQAGRLQAQ
jgi:transcriptional regulator with XRE-family HTH domain